MKLKTLLFAAALLAVPLAVSAEEMMNHDGMNHDGMQMEGTDKDAAPSTKAFKAADAVMMKDMAIQYSGNVDVDFVRGMIPHHQGAIAMAKIELEYGKDPEIRKLAEGIIKAQDDEIAFMQAWLAKNGGEAK
ncbi:DUF305 domain-containing protein [Mesorhizobium sp. BR1-1-16]|uniref:CopM family metallochaperone n=1 Tax=Mesorhizobium sp. BR1-1-16 TaxID=2876653 RepID=UPI001CCD4D64|nr:DUF305 domain-containing protein [Mesorhizobium sp. BR1-1-16]MBZ9937136.1 DUF305 domain-containing protein [Mesorhizobium sp. BR1-1-16]